MTNISIRKIFSTNTQVVQNVKHEMYGTNICFWYSFLLCATATPDLYLKIYQNHHVKHAVKVNCFYVFGRKYKALVG